MTKGEVVKFLILRTIGNFLLLFAVFGVSATFGPALYYEVQFRVMQLRGVQYKIIEEKPSLFGQLIEKQGKEELAVGGFSAVLTGPKEQILIPKDTLFNILIPKLGINTQVFQNVDPTNEKEFLPFLQKGVAHAKGTVFPGMKGNIYLFAHSTDNFWDVGRYNAIFYLLKDLTIGDEIIIFFENMRHNYIVYDSKIMEPSDISYLVDSQQNKEENLILQTCWPPGTTWKRLVVFAKPK